MTDIFVRFTFYFFILTEVYGVFIFLLHSRFTGDLDIKQAWHNHMHLIKTPVKSDMFERNNSP